MDVTCGSASGKFTEYFNQNSGLVRRTLNSYGRQLCILSSEKWYTLVQFQDNGGRASMKNWKKSIQHQGQNLLTELTASTSASSGTGQSKEKIDETPPPLQNKTRSYL